VAGGGGGREGGREEGREGWRERDRETERKRDRETERERERERERPVQMLAKQPVGRPSAAAALGHEWCRAAAGAADDVCADADSDMRAGPVETGGEAEEAAGGGAAR
jgi:hypothetical protein